ncbi:MAG: hypothetical protein HC923_10530, partial [Myxococcales bacterium]|nr:hypothetical protein [Myxococcales bacterium]
MKHEIVILIPNLQAVLPVMESLFLHPWIASYQIGFGPPILTVSPEVRARARAATSAMHKLRLYFEHCILAEEVREKLAKEHRRLVVRRSGPVEAEAVDAASLEALDLRLRLRGPAERPPGVDEHVWGTRTWPAGGVDLEGRWFISLDDPSGSRLLFHASLAPIAAARPESVALPLLVDPEAVQLWLELLAVWQTTRDDAVARSTWAVPLPHAEGRRATGTGDPDV